MAQHLWGSEFLLKKLVHPGEVEVCKYYWIEEVEVLGFGLASLWAFGAITSLL